MKLSKAKYFFILGLIVALATCTSAQVNLKNLCGIWTNNDSKEIWTCTDSTLLEGYAYEKTDTGWVQTEYLLLLNRNEQLYYIALPNGQTPTVFVFEESTSNNLTFFNRRHDFPQIIQYEFLDSKNIKVQVGTIKNPSKLSYTLTKTDL